MADADLFVGAGGLASGTLDTPEVEVGWEPVPPRRRTGELAVDAGAIVLGAVLTVIGTMVLHHTTAPARVACTLAGLAAIYVGAQRAGRWRFGARFELSLWLSLGWIAVVALAAALVDWLPVAESKNVSRTLTVPTLLRPALFSAHPLGTDRQGLDILGGVIYGARVSLVVGVGAVLIGTVVGGMIGIVAGYHRGRVDAVVSVLSDSMLAFPPLILLFGLVAVLRPNVRNVTLALAVLGIPTYIRLARANTLLFAQRDFVLAARILGAKGRRIILRELLPNVILPVASYGFVIVGAVIVAEASLSFLGLGIQRPNPTWGNMIAAGQTDFQRNPHLVFVPGTVLFLTVFALNRIGDKARRLWDPREGKL